jgi:Fe-S cluster biogenesis protein NfuA
VKAVSVPTDSGTLKALLQRVLSDEICPALQMDGGKIEVVEVSAGIVRVRLQGSCSGCPSTVMAILMGVEQELRKRIPEVEYLEAVP